MTKLLCAQISAIKTLTADTLFYEEQPVANLFKYFSQRYKIASTAKTIKPVRLYKLNQKCNPGQMPAN